MNINNTDNAPNINIKAIDKDIYEFLYEHKDLPVQGSEAWINGRLGTVGGSELEHAVSSPAGVVAFKLGLLGRFNSPYMTWGNVMEDQCRLITEWLFNTTVFEAGSVPSCLVPRKTFSMDGICMIPFKMDMNVKVKADGSTFNIKGTKLLRTIVEYKSPSRYIPIQSKIPTKYVKQISSGLSDIAIADIGLFMEMSYRLAKLDTLNKGNLEYHTDYHDNPKPDELIVKPPLIWGTMGLYITHINPDIEKEELPRGVTEEQVERIVHKLIGQNKNNIPKDLTELSNSDVNLLYNLIKSGFIKLHHFPLQTDNDELYKRVDFIKIQDISMSNDANNAINNMTDRYNKMADIVNKNGFVLGFMGWKMFEFNIVPIEKDPEFTLQYKKAVDDLCNNLDYLKQFIPSGIDGDIDKTKLIEEFQALYPKYKNASVNDQKNTLTTNEVDLLLDL
jgi:hypothetical protein